MDEKWFICVPTVNIFQSDLTEDLNRQVDKMTYSVFESAFLLQSPLSLPSTHEQKSDDGNVKVTHGLNGLTLTPKLTTTAKWPIGQEQKSMLSPLFGTIPWSA